MFSYSDISNFYKTVFPAGLIQALSIEGSPFRGLLSVTDDFGGASVKEVPMQYALPQARSRNAAKAINQRSTAKASLAQWNMKPGYDYATFQVKYADILRARTDKMAFGKLQQMALTTTLASLNDSINRSLYRDGTGSIGQVSALSTTTLTNDTVTLINKADSYIFEIGMEIQFFNTTTTNSVPVVLGAGASAFILSINTEAGTLTFDQALGAVSASIAANTYLLPAGDGVGFGSTVEDGAILGLAGYLPTTAPVPGTLLWGQDIGLYPTKLAGHRVDARNKVLWDEVQRMAARIKRLKGNPKHIFMAPEQLQNMIIGRDGLTQNFREVVTVKGDDGQGGEMVQQIGYSGVEIVTPNGNMKCFGDSFCPADRVYVLDMSAVEFHSMGEFPHMVTMGNVSGMLQETDQYAMQSRFFASGQLALTAPAYCGVLQVTPVI